MKHLLFLRHGATRENEAGVIQGQLDGHLTDRGRAQARAAGRALGQGRIDRAVTSDLARARDTLREILAFVGCPWTTDARLSERHFGRFHGRLRSDYAQTVAASPEPAHVFRPPDGEDYAMVHERVVSFLDEIAGTPGDQTLLVVTHGGVVRHALAHAHGLPLSEVSRFETDNASITELRSGASGVFEVVRMNDTSHLGDDGQLAGPRLSMI